MRGAVEERPDVYPQCDYLGKFNGKHYFKTGDGMIYVATSNFSETLAFLPNEINIEFVTSHDSFEPYVGD